LLIRNYLPADAVAVLVIAQRSPQAAQWSAAAYNQALAAGQLVLLAEENRHICGFAAARIIDREAEILNIAVDPLQRRTGVGSALVAAILEEAIRAEVQRVFLEVRALNQTAIAFYERHGFTISGERKQYYRAPAENAVLMQNLIGP
jgi:ribosomal-protein-alanine N-acetyltransferase